MVSSGAEKQSKLGVTFSYFCRLAKGNDSLIIFYEKPIEIGDTNSFRTAKAYIKMSCEQFTSLACQMDSIRESIADLPSEYTGRVEMHKGNWIYSIVVAYICKSQVGFLFRGYNKSKWESFIELRKILDMGFIEIEINEFPWGNIK